MIHRSIFSNMPSPIKADKNITKTKTKRIISESSRNNITKTKTIRNITERNISSLYRRIRHGVLIVPNNCTTSNGLELWYRLL